MRTFDKCNILVPQGINLTKWSVVACDQYTSEPDYWDMVSAVAGNEPSCFNIIYPEIYLNEPDKSERISAIHKTMADYRAKGLFCEYRDSLILVKRTQRNGAVRWGLMGAIDLEQYDFSKGSTSLVRATEGTVIERIPPRVSIRLEASLELPHILMLIDDHNKTVIEPLAAQAESFSKLYDFELMMDSGRLEGYLLDKDTINKTLDAIDVLGDRANFVAKYKTDRATLQFAVGDGNHSLATAKTCWEQIKQELTEEQAKSHPARYALVELTNVHDESLEFEPIHRVVTDTDTEAMIKSFYEFYPQASHKDNGGQKIIWHTKSQSGAFYVKDAPSKLAVGTLGIFLDKYLQENKGEVDYIHGEDVTEKLARQDNAIGFILPSMEKGELFETVIHDGALPRKTFSMGEAHDKKFYMECKEIVK